MEKRRASFLQYLYKRELGFVGLTCLESSSYIAVYISPFSLASEQQRGQQVMAAARPRPAAIIPLQDLRPEHAGAKVRVAGW